MIGLDPSALRILIVEDEALVALMIEDMVGDMGFSVAGVASTLDEAMSKVGSIDFDFAILDMNLFGRESRPVAEALVAKDIPFIFATGYAKAGVPGYVPGIPVLGKPFRQADLQATISAVLNEAA